MGISRNSLTFMSMLAAGLLLAGAALLVPSAQTFGSESDNDRGETIEHNIQLLSQAPAPPASQPVPPAAPIDAPASAGDSLAGTANNSPIQLPSTGSGGYLNSTETASLGYMLIGVGAALMGSGSMVWAYSRRRR